ncbi:CsxC family protein [Crassaminicella indica]|uniref:DUF7852 domain-containing protein n=1 Tax=Crassaminicella indica TaxID=2855394 RepID=A0ABX8RDI5_9CLOT|nr:hypothetical protein [Crassaminicella indica]QXM07138.1 hypothetical protein KVH43_05390 [Crassaminicella indica]
MMGNNAVVNSVYCTSVTGGNVLECTNKPFPIDPIVGGAVAKIPVVLAELTVQINLDSFVELPEPAYEIKKIKKNVKVTQCLLLQDTNTLFIKGFIRKNIEYATRDCSNRNGFCGDIKHCTVDVPFSCTTQVSFNGNSPIPIVNNTRDEFEFFKTSQITASGFAEKDQLLSGDFSEFNQVSTEYYNELPYCELISSKIVEYDEFLDRYKPIDVEIPFEEKEFTKIEEKMVIYLTLKLLQNQQVKISATTI